MNFLAVLIAVFLFFLAGLHFYWALFGVKNIETVIPTRPNGKKTMAPGKVVTSIIGNVLFLFAFVFANKVVGYVNSPWLSYLSWFIGILFVLRSIGDFKYLGFFKKIEGTPFAKMDTKYYSPFCLTIGVLVIILELST